MGKSGKFYIFMIVLLALSALSLTELGGVLIMLPYLLFSTAFFSVLFLTPPNIFAFVLAARLVHRLINLFRSPTHWILSCGVILVFMLVFTIFNNKNILYNIGKETIQENIIKNSPGEINSIAFVNIKRTNLENECDILCRRLLLNRQVDKIIIKDIKPREANVDWTETGTAYTFERRTKCPPVKFKIRSDPRHGQFVDIAMESITSAGLMRLENATGNCFIVGDAKLEDADAIFVHGILKEGGGRKAGFDLSADTISATGNVLYIKENQEFVLKHREASIKARLVFPVLFPDGTIGRGPRLSWGFLRWPVARGPDPKTLSLSALLRNPLGFELALDGTDANQKRRGFVDNILKVPGEIDPNALDVVQHFINKVAHAKVPDKDDVPVILRALQDRRVPVSQNVTSLIGKVPDVLPATMPEFASMLFERLNRFEPDLSAKNDFGRYLELDHIASAIFNLPQDALEPYFDDLVRLARHPRHRKYASRALQRFGDFGKRGVPMLLYLIDEDYGPRLKDQSLYQWMRTNVAALKGFCRMGKNGDPAVDETLIRALYQRMENGKILLVHDYWPSIIHMFHSLGANSEELRKYMLASGDVRSSDRFYRQVARAEKRIACGF